ncbi:hypothetical protein [Vibrio mexicanus]|nr:hypothetical protein [Vibrio mexicanus]
MERQKKRDAQLKSLLDSCSIALSQNGCDVLGLAIIKKRDDSKSIICSIQ